MPEEWNVKENCRICSSGKVIKYFDFGKMPLVDSFIGAGEPGDLREHLEVMFCTNCAISQLSVVVNPKILFSDYLYHSSVSRTFSAHCAQMARELKELLKRGAIESHGETAKILKCLDIASNDGCLLKEFKNEGYQVIGVDPAENLCAIAEESGVPSIADFWGREAARKVVQRIGRLDVITATNVFAHVDDLHEFVEAAHSALQEEGILVIEFPYMGNLIRYHEFDTIYHEHLSYFLVKPLLTLFSHHGMRIANLAEFDHIHGGTLRVYVVKDTNTSFPHNQEIIQTYLAAEEKAGLYTLPPYLQLEEQARKVKAEFREKLRELRSQGRKICAYGASAKGNTFVNYCRLDQEDLPFIVDDTPHKQGKLYAGTRIPVVPNEWLRKEKPDYVLILPWNFSGEIMSRNKEYRANGGKFIVAIPELKVL